MIFLVTDNIIIQVYKILLSCLNFVKIILKKVQFLFCLCCVDIMTQLSVMTQNRTAGKSSQKCSPVEAGSVVYPWWSGKKSSTKKDPPHSAMSDCQANIPHAFWLSERLSGSYESHIHNSYIASLHYHDPWLFSCIQLTPFPFLLLYIKEQMSYQNTFINDSCFIVHVYVFMKIVHCLFLKRILHEHYINI